ASPSRSLPSRVSTSGDRAAFGNWAKCTPLSWQPTEQRGWALRPHRAGRCRRRGHTAARPHTAATPALPAILAEARERYPAVWRVSERSPQPYARRVGRWMLRQVRDAGAEKTKAELTPKAQRERFSRKPVVCS